MFPTPTSQFSPALQGAAIGSDFLGGLITNIANSRQARLNRNFQAQQAQLARDWQEDMYNKYSSPSAMVQQYIDAGLNPALMYGKGQSIGQSFGASSPSGAQATLSNPADNLLAKMQSIVQLKEMIENNKTDRALKSSQASLFTSQVGLNNSQIQLNNSVIDLNKSNIDKITQDIEESIARTKNEIDRNSLIALEKSFKRLQNSSISYDVLQKQWAEDFKDIYGAYPAENAYEAVQRLIYALFERFGINSYIREK